MNKIKKNIKLFFIDLDGTTLDNKKGINHVMSLENLKAIKEAKQDGKKIIVSTGRSWESSSKFIKLIKCEYAVIYNGAQVVTQEGKVILNHTLTTRQILLILEIAQKEKLVLKFDGDSKGYGTFSFIQRFLCKKFGFTPVLGFHIDLQKQYKKVLIWGKTKWKMQKLVDKIKQKIDNISIVTSAKGWIIEITALGATKGQSNAYVSKLLNIDPKFTAHVGDSMNDSTTIGHVGSLIVMKNGDKQLKKLSPYRGPHYKNAGLGKILQGHIYKIKDKK